MIFLFCFILLGGHLTWSNKRKERWFVEKGRENNKWKKERGKKWLNKLQWLALKPRSLLHLFEAIHPNPNPNPNHFVVLHVRFRAIFCCQSPNEIDVFGTTQLSSSGQPDKYPVSFPYYYS